MSDKPIDYRILVDRYLDDALDPREAADLSRLMETRPEVAAYFAEASQLHSLLHEHETARIQPHAQDKRPGESASDTARVLYSEPPKEPARAVRREPSETRSSARPSPKGLPGGRDRQYLVPVLVAAGVLFGIVLLFSLSSSGPSRRETGKGESVRLDREAGKKKAEEDRARAERDRKAAEARLILLREEEQRAGQARLAASGAQEEEARKKSDEAFAEAIRKRKEEEERVVRLRQQEEAAKEAVAKASSEGRPQEQPVDPAPGKPLDPAPTKSVTQVLVAKLERVAGEVNLLTVSGRAAAKVGDDVLADQGLETVGPNGFAVLVYPDKTRLEAGPDTELREFKSERGKRVHVVKGEIRAAVSRQPKDEAMLFTSRDGEATVLGTSLRINVDTDARKGTRLDVEEGKVRLRNPEGKTVDVLSGHYAVAVSGTGPTSRRYVNLVVDPGFEGGGKAWQMLGEQGRVAVVTSRARWGSKALQLNLDPKTYCRVTQDIPVVPGASYDVSGWSWVETAAGASVTVIWGNASGGRSLPEVPVAISSTTRTWGRFARRVVAPAGASRLSLELRSNLMSGAAWFDDCEVCPVER